MYHSKLFTTSLSRLQPQTPKKARMVLSHAEAHIKKCITKICLQQSLSAACSQQTPKKARKELSHAEARIKKFRANIRAIEKQAMRRIRAALDAAENKVACPRYLKQACEILDEGFSNMEEEASVLQESISASLRRQDRIGLRIKQLEEELVWETSLATSADTETL